MTHRRSTNLNWTRLLSWITVAVLLCGSWVWQGWARALASQPASQPAAHNLDQLAWLSGKWVAQKGEGRLEETWSEPYGDCMVGMFRWTRNDKAFLYELLSVREEQVDDRNTLAFRLRHFHADLEAWEEKKTPLTFQLAEITPDEATFTFQGDNPWHYVYRRIDDNTMHVLFQRSQDGKPSIETIVFRRAS